MTVQAFYTRMFIYEITDRLGGVKTINTIETTTAAIIIFHVFRHSYRSNHGIQSKYYI